MANNGPKVVVVGAGFVDLAIKCDQLPSAGENVSGSALSYTATGPGVNQAVEAALCGCNVYLISKVGGDPFGQMVRDRLMDLNINADHVFTAEAKNTGAIVTIVNSAGENTSLTYIGANSALTEHDIGSAEQVISEADICLIHGQLPLEAVLAAIRCCKLHGTKIVLNPARPIEAANTEQVEWPLECFGVDVLIANLYEATNITEHHPATTTTRSEAAKLIGSDLIARGVREAVITMGKRGCMVVDREGADHIKAFEVEMVDQAGRGDAFAGALAAYFAVEDDIREAVKFASAAGALACTKFGSIEAMPAKAEIIELLQKEDTE